MRCLSGLWANAMPIWPVSQFNAYSAPKPSQHSFTAQGISQRRCVATMQPITHTGCSRMIWRVHGPRTMLETKTGHFYLSYLCYWLYIRWLLTRMRVSKRSCSSSCVIIKKKSLSIQAAVSRAIERCVLADIALSFVQAKLGRKFHEGNSWDHKPIQCIYAWPASQYT